ncbi:MAG: hypothetical protein CVU46_03860 [Chloroflexi bacterium HGW-Chloroflexi-8]|nr:MAG: hypothetical protein CVU46_03860 [Chloroflexi bacterium HGW-Chloroflexi-8]
MSEHLHQWMDAYLDGELSGIQKIEFELHLKECETCQENWKQQLALKQALTSLQPISGLKSPEVFLAEINMEIGTQKPEINFSFQKSLWYLIPTVLIFLFGALQIFGWVTGLINLIPGANRFLLESLPFINNVTVTNPWLNTTIQAQLLWSGIDWITDWGFLTQIFFLFSLSVLYCVWIVLWINNHQTKSIRV